MKTINGVIHGKTIELTDDPGLPDGVHVEVQVAVAKKNHVWGEGLRRCAGALANSWTDEDDRILAEIARDRQNATYRDLPE